MSIVSISASTLDELKLILSNVDADAELLFFETYPAQEIIKRTFVHRNHTFVIDSIDSESHEIPLVTVIREDVLALCGNELDPWDFDNMIWDLADNEKEYNGFDYEFLNHSGWDTKVFPYYEKNIPYIEDGSIIGFYWLPITSIIDILDEKKVNL